MPLWVITDRQPVIETFGTLGTLCQPAGSLGSECQDKKTLEDERDSLSKDLSIKVPRQVNRRHSRTIFLYFVPLAIWQRLQARVFVISYQSKLCKVVLVCRQVCQHNMFAPTMLGCCFTWCIGAIQDKSLHGWQIQVLIFIFFLPCSLIPNLCGSNPSTPRWVPGRFDHVWWMNSEFITWPGARVWRNERRDREPLTRNYLCGCGCKKTVVPIHLLPNTANCWSYSHFLEVKARFNPTIWPSSIFGLRWLSPGSSDVVGSIGLIGLVLVALMPIVGHKYMKRDDFKNYAAALRDKSAKFKRLKVQSYSTLSPLKLKALESSSSSKYSEIILGPQVDRNGGKSRGNTLRFSLFAPEIGAVCLCNPIIPGVRRMSPRVWDPETQPIRPVFCLQMSQSWNMEEPATSACWEAPPRGPVQAELSEMRQELAVRTWDLALRGGTPKTHGGATDEVD